MSVETKEKAASRIPMERRIIQVENLPDQAGITAALRRAFAGQPAAVRRRDDDDDVFAALLRQIH